MKSRLAVPRGSRKGRRITGLVLLAAAALVTAMSVGASAGTPSDGLGIQPGKIKHVWLIILENKSYDASFTGLNNNTYLWKTLPSQGVLLTNYYGTGHFSLDNYISMVSGQATSPTPGRLPLLQRVPGQRRHVRQRSDQPELRPAGLGGRAQRGRRAPTAASTRRACRRCSTSSTPRT